MAGSTTTKTVWLVATALLLVIGARPAAATNSCAVNNGVCEPGLGEDYVNCPVAQGGDCSHADGVCDGRERVDNSSPAECAVAVPAPLLSTRGVAVACLVLGLIGALTLRRRRLTRPAA